MRRNKTMAKTVQLDANGYRKFGMIDKLAYAAGDFGCNMSFALKSYLTIFWTQFMGIDEGTMAALMLLVQVWDAINDPVIGAMIDADKHQYKRNKFLTWIWVGSIGLLVAGAACFLPFPQMPTIAKNIMFVAGYILWDAFYTIANVPYGSLLSLISSDAGDRAELSTWRSVGSTGGSMLCQAVIPMLVYDSSNNMRGEVIFWLALVMGCIGFVCFQFMIRKTVVRVNQDVALGEDAPKFNVFKAIINFMKNRPALGATLAPVGMFIGLYGAGTAQTVMFQSYFQNARISGIISMFGTVALLCWMPFVRKLSGRFGKKEMITVGSCFQMAAYILMLLLPITPDTKGLVMYTACTIINAIGQGIGSCVSWSLMADAMDYNEWKTGVRDEGTTYAMHSFFRKLAQGVGPSVGLLLAAHFGYDASLKAAQTAQTALNMRYLTAAMYLFSAVVQFVSYAFIYNLDKKTLAKIQADLAERRAAKK